MRSRPTRATPRIHPARRWSSARSPRQMEPHPRGPPPPRLRRVVLSRQLRLRRGQRLEREPDWTDSAPLGCTSCHGMPPTGHLAVPAPVTAASCATCYPKAVNADGSINLVDVGHLNGKADTAALGCSSCHGDPTRKGTLAGTDANLASAPPVAPAGAPAYAVGAHQGHMNPTASSYLMPPIACAECHAVPADSAHASSPPAQKVVFGALSRSGGAAPSWDAGRRGARRRTATATSPSTGSPARTRPRSGRARHRSRAPRATRCRPPVTPRTPVPRRRRAASSATRSRSTPTARSSRDRHMNGKPDGGDCTSCHGEPPADRQAPRGGPRAAPLRRLPPHRLHEHHRGHRLPPERRRRPRLAGRLQLRPEGMHARQRRHLHEHLSHPGPEVVTAPGSGRLSGPIMPFRIA